MSHCVQQNKVSWKKNHKQTNKQTNKNNIKTTKTKSTVNAWEIQPHYILIITYVILCYNDKSLAFNKVKK